MIRTNFELKLMRKRHRPPLTFLDVMTVLVCCESLVSTTQTQHQMQRRLFLDVVVAQSTTILQLLASEDKTLLVGRDSLLVLDLCLDVLDRITRFDLQRDSLAGQGLDKDLHATTQTQDQVERRLFLDVVVAECTTVFELLASEDQTLLVGWNP